MKKFFLSTLLVLTAMTVSAQTTAALVRALGGASKAQANGSTVTLTADVTLGRAALVVPAGVTLDLTKDGARLILGNNSTLTVNGTVNARGHYDGGNNRWVDGSISIEPGTSTINGSGTINLSGKGRLLSLWSGDGRIRKLTLDGVTLAGVKDNNMELVWVGEGSELVLKSGAITGNTRIGSGFANGGGVYLHKSTFTMEGGEISGNRIDNDGGDGGGVYVDEGSAFTMSGGEISNNIIESKTSAHGGGVFNRGTFTMSGGRISGNRTIYGAEGGGVATHGTFIMTGGEISGNSAWNWWQGLGGDGGGVLVGGGTFIMKGGTIYGSSVVDTTAGANANESIDSRNGNPTPGAGAALVWTRGVCQFGKDGNLTSFGATVAEGGFANFYAGRYTSRTLSVNAATGVLSVTPAR